MEVIVNAVNELVDAELEKCVKEKGDFVDMHHAYAVILEEVEETGDELDDMKFWMRFMWNHVRNDQYPKGDLEHIERAALRCAAEAVQAAAMCKKALRLRSGNEAV